MCHTATQNLMSDPRAANLNELEDEGVAVVIRSNVTVLKTEPAFLLLFVLFNLKQ